MVYICYKLLQKSAFYLYALERKQKSAIIYLKVIPAPGLRPVGPKSTPLLRIQEPAIVERRGGRPIHSTTSSTISNRVDRSTRREPSAFERNNGLAL